MQPAGAAWTGSPRPGSASGGRGAGGGRREHFPGPGPASAKPGTRVGLQNTAARLAQLHGPSARLDLRPEPGGGTVAELRFPLRRTAGAARDGGENGR